tara:strand:- start:3422 stop:3871 length:450 start_codon:yes stop_codon:yes gene_type:complete
MGKRINNWQIAFQRAIEKERTFNRGTTDCVMFVLDVLSSYTDNKLADKYYGKYNNLSQGLKLLREWGTKGNTLNEHIINLFDKLYKRTHINLAQRGDVVGFNSEEISKINDLQDSGFTVGIMCEGFGRFVMRNGYQDIRRENLTMAWKV